MSQARAGGGQGDQRRTGSGSAAGACTVGGPAAASSAPSPESPVPPSAPLQPPVSPAHAARSAHKIQGVTVATQRQQAAPGGAASRRRASRTGTPRQLAASRGAAAHQAIYLYLMKPIWGGRQGEGHGSVSGSRRSGSHWQHGRRAAAGGSAPGCMHAFADERQGRARGGRQGKRGTHVLRVLAEALAADWGRGGKGARGAGGVRTALGAAGVATD